MAQRDKAVAEPAISPRMMNVEPILAVQDVFAATEYYKKVLDFEDVWLWGDPPDHGGAHRDGVGIQFSLNPVLAEASEGRAIWMRVQDVGGLYARHQERGAEIIGELEPKP